MTRNYRLILMLAVAAAALGALWFLAIAPKREEAARLDTEIAAKQTQADAAQAQVAQYEKARKAYRSNYAAIARLGKAVPADDDVRSLMVQLDAVAKKSNVDFRTINVGEGSGGGSSSSTPSSSSASGSAATASVPPGATVGQAGFTEMPFSFNFRGTFFSLSEFFTRLEHFVTVSNNRIDVTGRLLLLRSITLQPDQNGFPKIRAQIDASSYLVPATEGLTAGATSAGPSASAGTGQGSGSGGGSSAPVTTATATGVAR